MDGGLQVMVSWGIMLVPPHSSGNCSISALCAKYLPVTDNTFCLILDFIAWHICRACAEEGEEADMQSLKIV